MCMWLTLIGTVLFQRGPLQLKRILFKVRGMTTGQPGGTGTGLEMGALLVQQHLKNIDFKIKIC